MKRFEISYNPYSNKIHFRVAEPTDGNTTSEWEELPPTSNFMEFQNEKCIFENCVERILDKINNYINTTDELELVFIGTVEDFDVLQNTVYACSDPRAKKISCVHLNVYPSASTALTSIKRSFSRIKEEFDDYIDSDERDKKEIGEAVMKYMDTVKPEIPICVIGNYSVGKSALINAFIGREVLPSKSNSTTAINVIVRNDQNYKLEFKYLQDLYVIAIFKNHYSVIKPLNPDEKLLSLLFSGCEECSNEQEIIHLVLDRLNSTTEDENPITTIENCVSVYTPFSKSKLDFEHYSFCFIDTPGSNNGDEKSHRANLEDLMLDQTNALPIVVATRNALTSNDSFDLRNLLNEMEDGFSKQNCIIAISMSDELVTSQIKEEIPDSVREGISDPTIMYVSPIAAIGVKKEEAVDWIDEAYKEIFEMKVGSLTKTIPPQYNMTPRGRKLTDTEIKEMDKLLYASGLPSLEQELNYFAMRFAEYKKCTKGKKLLIDAMDMANNKLEESKVQLEKDKESKKKEQQEVRNEIIQKIDQIKKPSVNIAIKKVKDQYQSILDEYCKEVPSVVKGFWSNIHNRQYTMDDLGKDMQQHCQTHLYNTNANGIKAVLQDELLELASIYMSNVKSCVTNEYKRLSEDAQKDLDALFENESKPPHLNNVEMGLFTRIRLNFWRWVGNIFTSDEKFIQDYSREFIYQLKGNDNKLGLFAKQCIQEPARAYTKQINQWADNQIEGVKKTLNTDNAILSKLDDKIKELELEIDDLEKRLQNLSDVRTSLLNLLPQD